MSWQIQILLEDGWASLRWSEAATPYEYEDPEEASRMARMCYPEQVLRDRLSGTSTVRLLNTKTGEEKPPW